jgi:hypothetical protein
MKKHIFLEKRLVMVDGSSGGQAPETAIPTTAPAPEQNILNPIAALPASPIQAPASPQPMPEAMQGAPQMQQGPEATKPVTFEDFKKTSDAILAKSQQRFDGNTAKINTLANVKVDEIKVRA